jgi:glycosyltransferase involved in cell wall biosynthesis
MRILLVHRYYWPDVPAYAQMLRVMAERFSQEGFQVSVLSTMPGYNDVYDGPMPARSETVDGVRVRRMRLLPGEKRHPVLRALNLVRFCTGVLAHVLRHRTAYDVVTVASFPPIVMGLLGQVVRALTPVLYVFHYQDLWPEVALASGVLADAPLVRVARRIDRVSAHRASAIVVLSEDMRATLARRGVETDRVRVINNFIIDRYDAEAPFDRSLQKAPGMFRVAFVGNLGRFQGLEQVMDAAHLLRKRTDIELVFVGNGTLRQELEERAGDLLDRSVRFFPFQPLGTAMRMLDDADLALIPLAPGVIDAAYPSKTMTAVESDCAVLAVVEPDSQMAREIVGNGLGAVAASATAQDIATAIVDEQLRVRPSGGEIRRIGRQLWDREPILLRWLDLLDQLERERASHGGSGLGQQVGQRLRSRRARTEQ